MSEITVVGGGVAGLVAATACAEAGRPVRLLEARRELGGRGRSTDGPFVTNFGPHVLYRNGELYRWMRARDLLPPLSRAPVTAPIAFRVGGRARRVPPLALLPAIARLARATPPTDVDFRTWATERTSARAAELLSRSSGVFLFDDDPGRWSAAFVWDLWRQAFLAPFPEARYVHGGWSALIGALERCARERGVRIETGAEAAELPAAPVIVATELADARRLLGDASLHWPSARTVVLDLGLRARRGDPFVVWDLDEGGWVERFSAADRSLAPAGHDVVQAHIGLREGETADAGERRLEAIVDAGFRGWRERVAFRRRMTLEARTGALDPPGTTWRDRPAVDRGNGVFLAGDMVAAPGLLSDPSVTSALAAARGAIAWSERAGEGDGARRATRASA